MCFQHEAICEFPSDTFYEGKLITADHIHQKTLSPLKIWPAGRAWPIAFCHLEGKEEALAAGTAEGSEQSCSNKMEVDKVVWLNIIY